MAQARVNMPSLMKVDSPLPSLAGATAWLNGTPNPRDIKGHPILIHFWSISSETAKANLSQIAELRDQWRREGLRVIGVHVPNSQAEKEAAEIRDALKRFNLTEPCALDNDLKLCKDFENNEQAIPAYYLFDIDGKLNTSSTAEDGLVMIEDKLEEMVLDLRSKLPFCRQCELFLNQEAMFCSECGMKQTKVLSGSDWSLGEDSGTVSGDGKQMTGTGKDEMGGALGISYQWTFSQVK